MLPILSVAVLSCTMSGCGNDPTEVTGPLAKLTIEDNPSPVTVAQVAQLRAVGYDSAGKQVSPGIVTWTAVGAVSVSSSGVVTGTRVGAAFVTATSGSLVAGVRLDVTAKPAAKIRVGTGEAIVRAGKTFSVFTVVTDEDGLNVPKANVPVAIALTGGGGSLTGVTTGTTGADGAVVLGNLMLSGASGVKTLTFTAPGFAPRTLAMTLVSGAAKNIEIVSGNNQTAARGGGLGAITVRVTDAEGYPVGQVGVTFTVASGGGTIPNPVQSTRDDGTTETGLWVLGAVGTNTVVATAQGVANSVTFTATATPVATRVEVSLPKTTIQVGESIQAILAAFTETGAPYLLTSPAKWVIESNFSATVTDGGIITGTSAGTANLIVFVGSAGTSMRITVTGASTRRLTVTSGPVVGQSGAVLPTTVVQLVDAISGAPIAESGRPVTVGILGGGFTSIPRLTGETTVSTDAAGVARFTGLIVTAPPSGMGLSFRSDGVIPVLVTGSFSVGIASALVIYSGNSQSGITGQATPARPSVRLVDAVGTVLPEGRPVTFTVTSGGGSVTNATVLTAFGGIASVGSWILGSVGINTLSVSSAGVTTPVIFTAVARPF